MTSQSLSDRQPSPEPELPSEVLQAVESLGAALVSDYLHRLFPNFYRDSANPITSVLSSMYRMFDAIQRLNLLGYYLDVESVSSSAPFQLVTAKTMAGYVKDGKENTIGSILAARLGNKPIVEENLLNEVKDYEHLAMWQPPIYLVNAKTGERILGSKGVYDVIQKSAIPEDYESIVTQVHPNEFANRRNLMRFPGTENI